MSERSCECRYSESCEKCCPKEPKPEAPIDYQEMRDNMNELLLESIKPEPPPAQAPREWWIRGATAWQIGGSNAQYPAGWLKSEADHVIEYAAYQKLQRELAGANSAISEWSHKAAIKQAALDAKEADLVGLARVVNDLAGQVEQALAERDQARAELAGHMKDHAEDWKRIQDAERALTAARKREAQLVSALKDAIATIHDEFCGFGVHHPACQGPREALD